MEIGIKFKDLNGKGYICFMNEQTQENLHRKGLSMHKVHVDVVQISKRTRIPNDVVVVARRMGELFYIILENEFNKENK